MELQVRLMPDWAAMLLLLLPVIVPILASIFKYYWTR